MVRFLKVIGFFSPIKFYGWHGVTVRQLLNMENSAQPHNHVAVKDYMVVHNIEEYLQQNKLFDNEGIWFVHSIPDESLIDET